MNRLAALLLLSALSVVACGGTRPGALPDRTQGVQYDVDFGGASVPIRGQDTLGVGGWTLDFACAYRSDHARVGALRFDDSSVPDWDLARDGGTPPPPTRSGLGVSLRVEHDGGGTFTVTLGVGGKTYTGTAADDSAGVGFHHVGYATPPELLTIDRLRLTANDRSSLTLTGTASFPMGCTGM